MTLDPAPVTYPPPQTLQHLLHNHGLTNVILHYQPSPALHSLERLSLFWKIETNPSFIPKDPHFLPLQTQSPTYSLYENNLPILSLTTTDNHFDNLLTHQPITLEHLQYTELFLTQNGPTQPRNPQPLLRDLQLFQAILQHPTPHPSLLTAFTQRGTFQQIPYTTPFFKHLQPNVSPFSNDTITDRYFQNILTLTRSTYPKQESLHLPTGFFSLVSGEIHLPHHTINGPLILPNATVLVAKHLTNLHSAHLPQTQTLLAPNLSHIHHDLFAPQLSNADLSALQSIGGPAHLLSLPILACNHLHTIKGPLFLQTPALLLLPSLTSLPHSILHPLQPDPVPNSFSLLTPKLPSRPPFNQIHSFDHHPLIQPQTLPITYSPSLHPISNLNSFLSKAIAHHCKASLTQTQTAPSHRAIAQFLHNLNPLHPNPSQLDALTRTILDDLSPCSPSLY